VVQWLKKEKCAGKKIIQRQRHFPELEVQKNKYQSNIYGDYKKAEPEIHIPVNQEITIADELGNYGLVIVIGFEKLADKCTPAELLFGHLHRKLEKRKIIQKRKIDGIKTIEEKVQCNYCADGEATQKFQHDRIVCV